MRVRDTVTVTLETGEQVTYRRGDTIDPDHEALITNPTVIEHEAYEFLEAQGTMVLIECAKMLNVADWAVLDRAALINAIASEAHGKAATEMLRAKFADERRAVDQVDASDTGLQVVHTPTENYEGADHATPADEPTTVIEVDLSDSLPDANTGADGHDGAHVDATGDADGSGAADGTDGTPGAQTGAEGVSSPPIREDETVQNPAVTPERTAETAPAPEQTITPANQVTPAEGVSESDAGAMSGTDPATAIEGLKTGDQLREFAMLQGIAVPSKAKVDEVRATILDELAKRPPADTKVINVADEGSGSLPMA